MILKDFFTHPVQGSFRERITNMMKSLNIWSKTEKLEAQVRGIDALTAKYEAKAGGLRPASADESDVKQPGIILSGLRSKLTSEELVSRIEEHTKNL